MCFPQSLKEKNKLLQRLKETIIQFTSSYWFLIVIKTPKDLGEALGPLECDTVPFVMQLTSRREARAEEDGDGTILIDPCCARPLGFLYTRSCS